MTTPEHPFVAGIIWSDEVTAGDCMLIGTLETFVRVIPCGDEICPGPTEAKASEDGEISSEAAGTGSVSGE